MVRGNLGFENEEENLEGKTVRESWAYVISLLCINSSSIQGTVLGLNKMLNEDLIQSNSGILCNLKQ